MVNVIMHGCNGHMGRVITDIAAKDDEINIVAGIDPFDDGHNTYPVFSSIEKCDVKADVIIDFASAKAEDALLDYCEKNQVDPFDDGHNTYPVFSSIEKCDVKADVIIDFASAKAEDALLDYCEKNQVPVVVCTTGLSEEQLDKVRRTACKVAVLKSANMSLGINTLFKLLQDAASIR